MRGGGGLKMFACFYLFYITASSRALTFLPASADFLPLSSLNTQYAEEQAGRVGKKRERERDG